MTKSSLSILLVEDNIAHVELISRAVEDSALDADIVVCDNISDAVKFINSNIPDLVITDFNLPDGKGTSLISIDKENHTYPVILMTSYGDESVAVEAIKAGALDYVVKSSEAFMGMPKLIDRVLREWKNITGRQQAQQALHEKESEQREILNSIMDAVITIDENSTVLTFNKTAENIFGYSAEEIIGKSLLCLIPENYRSKHEKGLSGYLESGVSKIIELDGGVELEALRKDGASFPIRLSIAELQIEKNGMRRFIGICQDLSQLKQQEEQLRRSQKMDALGKLTGGIAHDYNNMLGIILGYAELLELSLDDRPESMAFVNEIFHAGKRGAKLTKKLLSFSRQTTSDTKVLNLNAVLHAQQHMLEKTLTARIKLNLKLAKEDCLVDVNGGELEDAIINMSINAMHAIEGNGNLTIQTRKEIVNEEKASRLQITPGNYILLSLKDTGIGMDAATKEKIFEPFFSTKGEMGTGLGLSQVYGFVERSNGLIKVDSEIGVGSCVTLYFPCHFEKENEEPSEESTPNKEILTGSEIILLVDDEVGLRNLTTEIFRANGYKVLSAASGKEALDILEKEKVDLLFSDVIMPEMDGFELAKIVQEKYPSIKIQLASGFSDERHSRMDDDNLYDNLLAKPYRVENLLKKIRGLLD